MMNNRMTGMAELPGMGSNAGGGQQSSLMQLLQQLMGGGNRGLPGGMAKPMPQGADSVGDFMDRSPQWQQPPDWASIAAPPGGPQPTPWMPQDNGPGGGIPGMAGSMAKPGLAGGPQPTPWNPGQGRMPMGGQGGGGMQGGGIQQLLMQLLGSMGGRQGMRPGMGGGMSQQMPGMTLSQLTRMPR